MVVGETQRAESARDNELRKQTRRQVIRRLEDDLNGDELLMKEVWEACADGREIDVVKGELRGIIAAIRARGL